MKKYNALVEIQILKQRILFLSWVGTLDPRQLIEDSTG